MAPLTMNEAVKRDDLILAYKSREAHMLLVKSAPGDSDTNRSTSSITVEEVNFHVPDYAGCWTQYGPKVYYVKEDNESEQDDEVHRATCINYDHSTDLRGNSLDDFLKSVCSVDTDGKDDSSDVTLIVNPHGRDVLKHYFHGTCPHCGGSGWFCPGCGGVSTRFPDLFASCGFDMSCPVCLGYDFALEDKRRLEELDGPEMDLWTYKYEPEKSYLCKGQITNLKRETLALVKERYELINARKAEMGIKLENVDKLLDDWKESHF